MHWAVLEQRVIHDLRAMRSTRDRVDLIALRLVLHQRIVAPHADHAEIAICPHPHLPLQRSLQKRIGGDVLVNRLAEGIGDGVLISQDTCWCHTVSVFTAFSPNRIGDCNSYYVFTEVLPGVVYTSEVVQ